MNIKSLVATFALVTAATTTAAMADVRAQGGVTVGGSFSVNTASRPIVRDHRTPARPVIYQPLYQSAYQPAHRNDWRYHHEPELVISQPEVMQGNISWYRGAMGSVGETRGFVPVTQPTRIATVREAFDFSSVGNVDKLQIQAVAGTTVITQLGVTYLDGTIQMIPVNETINAQQPYTSTIDFAGRGRPIQQINVYGTSPNGSAFQLLASS